MNEKQSMYLAVIAIVLATIGIGMSYYKASGPEGPTGPQGPVGPTGPKGPPGITDMNLIAPNPGINLEVTDVEIDSDGITHVSMNVTDGSGQPMTPDDFSMNFMLAAIEKDASGTPYYNNYFKATDEGATYTLNGQTMQPAISSHDNPDRERGGTWETISPGELVYTFANAVPVNYDASATHLLAAYAYQSERTEIANVVYAFVPSGGTPNVWEVSDTETCNRCHDPLAAHGGPRQEYTLCLVCHTPDGVDPETGESIDMKVMIHKIHMGEGLPSVEAGDNYYIVGHGQSVHDYSEVVFPTNVLNCEVCHSGPDGDSYKENPSRAACGSCHDNVDFETGENHDGLPQTDDNGCSGCHQATMISEFDLSIPGAHVVESRSSQLPGFHIHIVSVTNTEPGQKPEITYSVKNDLGDVIPLSGIDRVMFSVAGPTTDYATYWEEDALSSSTDNGDGTYDYIFSTAIPSDANGSWAVGAEGRAMVDIDGGVAGTVSVRDTTTNEVYYFPVTDSVAVPRRTVVSQENCDACHEDLSLHGDNRRSVGYCVVCHMPMASDESVRADEAMPPTTIDFKVMIHKIHLGEEGGEPYIIYGYRGSVNDFGNVLYPADLRDCDKCHVDDSYMLPLDSGVLGTTVKQEGEVVSYTPPMTSACLSCHPSDADAAHAEIMTTGVGVESCPVCHGVGTEFAMTATTDVWAETQFTKVD